MKYVVGKRDSVTPALSLEVVLARKLRKVDQVDLSPAAFIKQLQRRANVKSDAELARACGVTPSTLSKVRNKVIPLSDWLLLKFHDTLGIEIAALKDMMELCSDARYGMR